MNFIKNLKTRAKNNIKTIVLPETEDKRVLEAASIIEKEGFANIILIGDEEKMSKDYDLSNIMIINPKTFKDTNLLIDELYNLRKEKGLTYEEAKDLILNNYLYFGCMLVKLGYADGQVSGASHSSADTLRPALQIIKTDPKYTTASAFFLMDVPDFGTYIYSDCGMIQNPTSEELSEIAKEANDTYKLLIGDEPKLAFLSHSTLGSSKCSDVDKVVNALKITKEKYPDIVCDGEFQFDTAVIKEVAKIKAPNSEVAGKANVLIFPDLDAGNIAYKITERMGHAKAYGPITQGLNKPVNDLSRGCSALDIVGAVAITCIQAQKEV